MDNFYYISADVLDIETISNVIDNKLKLKLSDEAKNAGKKALEKAGVADLDTGAAIAGGNEELRGSALIERGLRKRNL